MTDQIKGFLQNGFLDGVVDNEQLEEIGAWLDRQSPEAREFWNAVDLRVNAGMDGKLCVMCRTPSKHTILGIKNSFTEAIKTVVKELRADMTKFGFDSPTLGQLADIKKAQEEEDGAMMVANAVLGGTPKPSHRRQFADWYLSTSATEYDAWQRVNLHVRVLDDVFVCAAFVSPKDTDHVDGLAATAWDANLCDALSDLASGLTDEDDLGDIPEPHRSALFKVAGREPSKISVVDYAPPSPSMASRAIEIIQRATFVPPDQGARAVAMLDRWEGKTDACPQCAEQKAMAKRMTEIIDGLRAKVEELRSLERIDTTNDELRAALDEGLGATFRLSADGKYVALDPIAQRIVDECRFWREKSKQRYRLLVEVEELRKRNMMLADQCGLLQKENMALHTSRSYAQRELEKVSEQKARLENKKR